MPNPPHPTLCRLSSSPARVFRQGPVKSHVTPRPSPKIFVLFTGFLAPEILNEVPYDHISDIYSLGVIFWEILVRKVKLPTSLTFLVHLAS